MYRFIYLSLVAALLACDTAPLEDVPYGSLTAFSNCVDGTQPCNRLDIHPVENANATVLLIHGGGWRTGDKRVAGLIDAFKARDLTVVSANYSLTEPDRPSYPQAEIDVRAALNFARGLDKPVILAGISAGAHLALLVGFQEQQPLEAIIGFWGPYDLTTFDDPRARDFLGDPSLAAVASPITYAPEVRWPVVILHSFGDQTVPFDQALELAFTLRDSGRRYAAAVHADADHGFAGWGGAQVVVDLALERVELLR